MKRLLIYFLIINTVAAQNFSPTNGAGIQSSPATSGVNNFTSPSSSVLNQGSTSPVLGNQAATAPSLIPDLTLTPLDESAGRLNQSPNPLPGEINNSDAFDTSLIQAQEAPINLPPIEQGQGRPNTTNGSSDSTNTTR